MQLNQKVTASYFCIYIIQMYKNVDLNVIDIYNIHANGILDLSNTLCMLFKQVIGHKIYMMDYESISNLL